MKGFIRTRTAKDGKPRYQVIAKADGRSRAIGTYRLKKDAEARLKRAESGRASGTGAATFAEFYEERYLPAKRNNLKPSTLRDMEGAMKHHILPAFGDCRLENILTVDVQDFVNRLAAPRPQVEGAPRRRDLSPATVQKVYRYFRSAIRQAQTWGELESNPCQGIILPRSDRGELDYLQPEEVLSLLENCREPERSLFALLAWSGLRLGEGLALAWRHIDLKKGVIRVERSWGDVQQDYQEPKTATSRRAVPVIPSLAGLLRYKYEAAGRPSPDTMLFTMNGTPLDHGNTRRQFYKALKAAGLRHVSIHSLRHTFASGMIASGASIKALQRALGHASAIMTLNVYSHLIEESLEPVLLRADTLFTGTGGQVLDFSKSGENG